MLHKEMTLVAKWDLCMLNLYLSTINAVRYLTGLPRSREKGRFWNSTAMHSRVCASIACAKLRCLIRHVNYFLELSLCFSLLKLAYRLSHTSGCMWLIASAWISRTFVAGVRTGTAGWPQQPLINAVWLRFVPAREKNRKKCVYYTHW